MAKVFENNGRRLLIFSDDGVFKLSAIRRAIVEDWNGIIHYYGSEWHIHTFQRSGKGFIPYTFAGVKYIVGKKKEIINMLSKSVQFKQAYAELTNS